MASTSQHSHAGFLVATWPDFGQHGLNALVHLATLKDTLV